MPSSTKNPISPRLTMLPRGKRFPSSRNVRANCCMPISARQIDSGTDLSAHHAEFGHKYSKPRPLSVNSTMPNALRWNRYQKRSEDHTSELPSLIRISYAVFCLKKKNIYSTTHTIYIFYHQ